MQGRMVRSWAPLGVLLICLHLPGLSARSIGAAEEKAPQDSGTNLLLPGQPSSTGPSNSEHPQSQPELKSNDLRSAPLNPNASPSDGSQAAGGPGVQSWAPSEGLSYVDSWAYEDPWQMMAAGNEDYVGEALPQELYFFSNDADLPPGSGPLPAGSSGHPTGAQPETSLSQKDPESTQPPLSNTGAQEQTFTQRPFWNFINKIRQALLSGRPCGLLKPRVPLAGKGPATGLGTRPMPHPGVLGGIKNPNTGWGNINRFPGISGGNMNQFPGITGGNMNQFPGIGGGIINRIPGIGGGNMNPFPGLGGGIINRIPGIGGGNMNPFPGLGGGIINRIPGIGGGNMNPFPGIGGGIINRIPGIGGGNMNPFPGLGGGIINRIPGIGGGNMNPFPGLGGGIINRIPGIGGGNMNPFPGIGGGIINRIPGIGGGNMNPFPGIGGGIINRIPGIGGGNLNNLFPPGVAHPPGSSRSISPDLANPENAGSE